MSNRKTTYSLGVVLLALVVGLLVGVLFTPRLNKQQVLSSQMGNRINGLLQMIDHYYVDPIDYDSLTDQMMNAMLSTLDPHSCYLSPKNFAQENEIVQGQFEGIGVTLFYLGDTVYASTIIPGSPASRAGIHPGDRIMYVDSTLVSGAGMTKDPSSIVGLIRGPRNSSVTLGIQRKGSSNLVYRKVQRNVIHHASIPACVMINNETGYILVTRFSETTASEFHNALLQLNQQGMKHLVLDLRNNGGGVLSSAIEMADELLPKGDLIVYTQGTHERRRNIYATKGGLFEEGRLSILINEQSASASEVVSGAIQDNDRGAIFGHRSFGKGLVQHQFSLPDGAGLLLTIARYYSPSGRCIQRPYDKGSDEYYSDYLQRVLSDYNAADSILSVADTSQAFLTKNGRKVYGGGGIQPDVTLPYLRDTSLVYFNKLVSKQVFESVIYPLLFNHYDDLIQKYPSNDIFMRDFKVDDATWQAVLLTADKKGIKRHPACISKYGSEMRNRFKALLALSLYGDNAYYSVAMPFDNELQQAIKKNVKLGK